MPVPRSLEGITGNARAKLNVSYFNGCLFVAAVFGLIAESWAVFMTAMALTIACGIYMR